MKTRQALLYGLMLLGGILIYTLTLYSRLPDQIPIHWNMRGEVDGWGDKRWAAFLMPGTMALLLGMLVALPVLSPRNYSIEPFQATFNYVMLVCCGLMGYTHIIMLHAALNPHENSGRALIGGMFLFFALMGNVLGRTRRNFWLGIRTPWTLASNTVWIATHRLGGRIMVATGVIGAIAVFLGASIELCSILLIVAIFVPVIYSYVLYQKLEGGGSP